MCLILSPVAVAVDTERVQRYYNTAERQGRFMRSEMT